MNRFTEAQLNVIRQFKFADLLCIGLGFEGAAGGDVPECGFFELNDGAAEKKKRSVEEGEELLVRNRREENDNEENPEIINPKVNCTSLDALSLDPWRDIKMVQNYY